jgi:hypothetical protein
MLIAERIQKVTDALGAVSVLTEQKFLAIGDSVERAVAILSRMAVTFETLLSQMRSNVVIQAKHDLALAAGEAGRLSDATGSEVPTLERMGHTTEAIKSRITAMRHIARDVDMLAINARLISAGMGEAGVDFLGFAIEIRRSGELAQDTLERLGHELTEAGRQLALARSAVMAFAERHSGALQAIPICLAAAVDTINAHDDLATAAATAVATRTADVHQQVGNVIMRLQLGDITRQRIDHAQHVAGVLLCLVSNSSDLQSEWHELSPSGIASLLQTGCNLTAAQLRDAAAELDREAERVAGSLSRLADDAKDISQLGAQAYGAADRQHRDFMEELEGNVREAETLFAGLRAAHDDTGRLIASVLTTAHTLTGNIDKLRELDADIRIMGLNTTLRCGRLGVLGRPLSVIAQELRDCGSRTASQAGAALSDLKLLVGLAGSFGATGKEPRGAPGGDFAQELVGAVDLLGRTGRALSAALARLYDDSGAVSQLLQGAARDFSVRHDIGGVLQGISEELIQIAALQASAARTETAAMDRLLARFSAIYTMARERDIHARFAGPRVQEPDSAAEPDLADVLF